ncbi:MAG: hypothetical protein U9P90_00815 [Patescibacteria group bacterium]|nr:hypothetical protein [Patescibacteria group bacterium]
MFEDKKLPKEPEDIFAGVKEPTEPTKPLIRPASPPSPEPTEIPPPGTPAKTVASATSEEQVVMEEPKKSWARLLILIVVSVVVVGVGTWLVIQYYPFSKPDSELEKKEIADDELKVITTTPQAPEIKPPVDSDGDGLTDEEELLLGTDALLADSDADGLPDRDEVKVYKTDPLDSDTDKDGFFDGEEVQNGYDPKGSGRLYEVPLPGQE